MILSTHTWNGFEILKIKEDQLNPMVYEDIMEVLGEISIKGKNVVDGGSNIGVFSLEASRMVGEDGMVYAFELQKEICELSVWNFKINNASNIVAHHRCLSSKSGGRVGLTPIDYDGELISSVGVKTEIHHIKDDKRTETIALDNLNLENIGLIKLDLEGHEPYALEGMWGTIDRCKPFMVIELSEGYLGGDVQRTIDRINSHGYFHRKLSDCDYFFIPV